MGKAERAQKKLEKKRMKARKKRYRKINNGLDICLIFSCFLFSLIASALRVAQSRRERLQ